MDGLTRLDQQQYEAVTRRVRELQASLPKAVGAYYDTRVQQIVVQLSSRLELRFSPEDAAGLEHASSADLDRIEITGSGFGIHFPCLAVDLSVPAVLLGRLGSDSRRTSRPKHAIKRDGFGSPIVESGPAASDSLEHRPKLVAETRGKHASWHGLRPIAGGLSAARAPERTDAKVKEHHHNDGSDQKHSVIRTMSPTRPHAPEIGRERDHREEKESAGNLQPQDASYAPKRAQKTAQAAGHASTGLSACADRLPRLLRMNSSTHNGLRAGGRSGIRTFRKPLTHHSAGNPHADSQDASDRLWSHPIYDGSSDSA